MGVSSSRIKSYNIFKVRSRLKKPLSDATHTLSEISFIVLRIRLENGVVGESYLLSFQYSPQAIVGALKDMVETAIGFEACETGKVYEKHNQVAEYFGNEGINRWPQAAVNVAMWDGWAKTLGQPVYKLLGVHREKCPVYGSGGWLSYSTDELINEVVSYKDRGFKAVKIKVGSPDWKTDLDRLKLVRRAVGDEINMMMDANQGMELPAAIQLAKKAEELGIYWFEEPLNHQHFEGYEILKNQTGISLAMGEREYDTGALKGLISRKALDIWQPDVMRIGGVDAWRQSAALADCHQIPVLPHYYKDYDVSLVCSAPNGKGVESFDWIDELIDNPMNVEDGFVHPHDRPGWGFSFLDDRLEEISI